MRKYILLILLLLITISCLSKKEILKYNIKINEKIINTDKKFHINFSPITVKKIINESSVIKSIYDYFGNNLSNYENDCYIFNINIRDCKIYTNKTQDDKIKCVFIIKTDIKIHSPENKPLLNLFLYSRNEEIIDNKKELESIKNELASKTINDLFVKLNNNQNYINLLNDENPKKSVVDSSNFKNWTEPWQILYRENKNNLKLLLSFCIEADGGFNFNLNGRGVSYIGKVSPAIELYPIDFFSIKYRFGFYVLNNLLSLLNLLNGYYIFQFDNSILFNINIYTMAFACPSIYLDFGYSLTHVNGSNYKISPYNIFSDSFTYPDSTISNIHSIKIGIGFKITPVNPYIMQSGNQFGFELFYNPLYLDSQNEWFHSIGFSFCIIGTLNGYIYKNKPYKFVGKKRFQQR